MEILHRISLNVNTDRGITREFRKLGILSDADTGKDSMGVVFFEILESDPRWLEISNLVKKSNFLIFTQTFFEKDEILQSEYLRLIVIFEHGYPQPESTWVSQKPNYEVLCSKCGRFNQTRRFEIKAEPALRGNHFMTLLWGSPIFVSIEVLEKLESLGITGFQPMEVIVRKVGQPSSEIMQLLISKETDQGLVSDESVDYEQCDSCGQRKYYAHRRGVMQYQRNAIPPNVDMMETAEWFGAGSKKAYKEVIITNRLAKMIINEAWKGVMMKVVKAVD